MFLKRLTLAIVFFAAVVKAQPFDPAADLVTLDDEAEEGEERTVFTSNGNYFIALNTTYLLLYATLFGIGLLAALAISALFGAASSDDSGYGYGHESGYGSAHGEDPHGHGYRNKRFAATIDESKRSSSSSRYEHHFISFPSLHASLILLCPQKMTIVALMIETMNRSNFASLFFA